MEIWCRLHVREQAAVLYKHKGCGVDSVAEPDVLRPDGGVSHGGGLAVVANLWHPDSYEANAWRSAQSPEKGSLSVLKGLLF